MYIFVTVTIFAILIELIDHLRGLIALLRPIRATTFVRQTLINRPRDR